MGLGLILEGSLSAARDLRPPWTPDRGVQGAERGTTGRQRCSCPSCLRWRSASIVFSIVKADLVSGPMLLLIPPVVTFLPGGMLTTAMIELANGDAISGSSRLVAGTTKLLLLVFGYVVAAELVGLPAAEAFAQSPKPFFGWWAPWVGVLIYGIGTYVHLTAPKTFVALALAGALCGIGRPADRRQSSSEAI